MIFNEYMNSSYKLSDGRAAGGRTKLDALLSGRSIKDAQFQNLPLVRLHKKFESWWLYDIKTNLMTKQIRWTSTIPAAWIKLSI